MRASLTTRSLSATGAALSAAAALLLAGCSAAKPAAQVAAAAPPVAVVTTVTPTDLQQTLELEAELTPFQQVDLYAKEAGYVTRINVDYGSRVTKGEVLATLEIPELNDQLAQATANNQAAIQDVARAQRELDRAVAAADLAHLDASRLDKVIATQPNLVAQEEVDNANAADIEAQAQVAADKSALAAAQARVTATKEAEDQVQTLLGYATITAPFTGVVTRRFADTGTLLQAGVSSHVQAEPLVTLSQNDLLRLVIPVPETAVAAVHLGQPVQVRVPALKQTFPGRVARFADALDLQTRTMHTEVDVPNPRLTLIPGMYADTDLVLANAPHALTVPVTALSQTASGGNTVAVVLPDNRVAIRPVRIGLETSTQAQILSGVTAGERVVASGQANLRPGEQVTPRIQPAAPAGGGQ